MLPVTVAWSSWRQYNTLRSLLSVLWMTSYFYIMERKGQNQIRRMNGQGRERGYAGPTRVFSDCRRIRCVLRFCGWRHIFIQWSEWARIKDHARILSSSPGGGNGGGVEVCRLRLHVVWLLSLYRTRTLGITRTDSLTTMMKRCRTGSTVFNTAPSSTAITAKLPYV